VLHHRVEAVALLVELQLQLVHDLGSRFDESASAVI
jgi:hypothetical protein